MTMKTLLSLCTAAALTVVSAPAATAGTTPAPAAADARAAAQSIPTSAAAGHLAASGCTESSGVATCDLWAKAGTTQVLGQQLPIWGYADSDLAPATAPGPLLVVHQGDRVDVTLHNSLDEPTSLAFPGQPAEAFSAGLSPAAEVTGTAPGGSTTYSFTASRPGTFAYEAGHTADGARQVAMGLAGALVVLPADPSGAYGTPATAYDDEAVLVLSEIDPDLNAHPATFDMRGFRPRLRLVNGKAFPSTDPVGTDQGHTVLLRYVNVGSVPHPMSLLGATQTQVAEDGHPLTYPAPELIAAVQPGGTADTLVHMPTGPESKVTLFEAGQHLDNDGQTTSDPAQLAFGGMMTFLDTAAPAPSTDAVGPVSRKVAASPNPSDGTADVTVRAHVSDASTGGSAVTAAELVVDDATSVGVGFGLPMQGSFDSPEVDVTGTIPATAPDCAPATGPVPVALSCLAPGKHRIFVRAQDAAGNWGVVGVTVLRLPKTGPGTRDGSLDPAPTNGTEPVRISATGDDSDADGQINDAEYFIDTAGDPGTGSWLQINRTATIVSEDGTIPAGTVAALSEGVHHVLVRSHDSLNLWGPLLDIPLVVDKTGPTVTAAAVMPNPSNGKIDDPGNPGNLVVSGQISDLDADGGQQSRLVDAEGFLEPSSSTPDPGTGFQLYAVDGDLDSSTEAVYGQIPLSAISHLTDGDHTVYVRGQDAAGNWGPLFATPLTVDTTAPVLSNATALPSPVNLGQLLTVTADVNEASFGGAEFWTGANDPGEGNASAVPLSYANGKVSVTVPVTGLPSRNVTFNVRVQDLAGNWSNVVSKTVFVRGPGGAAGMLGFQRTTGAVTVARAAGIPRTAGNKGVAMTLRGGRRSAPAYVSASTGAGVTGYAADFAFAQHTLRAPAAGTVSLFQAATTGGRPVFTLQLRTTRSGSQVRAVLARLGAGPLAGDWRRLSGGPHHVRLDWASGTASSNGHLQVLLDGRKLFEETANTTGLTIRTLRLGAVSGVHGAPAGSAYFDGYRTLRVSTAR